MAKKKPIPAVGGSPVEPTIEFNPHLAFVNFRVLIDFIDTLSDFDQCRFYDIMQEYRRTIDDGDRSKFDALIRDIFGDTEEPEEPEEIS